MIINPYTSALPNPLTTGLVSYWKFDTNANDSVGPNHATNSGAVLTTGKINNCYEFDGTDSAVLAEPSAAGTNLTVGTFNFWLKTADAGSGYRGVVLKPDAYGIFLINNNVGMFDWGAAAERNSGVDVSDDTWHMITLLFESGVANETKIYIDGSLVLTTTITVNTQLDGIVFGAGNNPASVQYYSGLIDEVGLWNRKITGAEITELYNSGSGIQYPF
jgi:hypothetical protein